MGFRMHSTSNMMIARSCFFAILGLGLAGCTGSGSVVLVPMVRSDFGPQEPLVQTVPVGEAYYGVDRQGELTVALRCHQASLWGRMLDFDWQMSIVLDGLPAGSQKLYRAGPYSVRTVQSYGGDHRRGQSSAGVAVVDAPARGRLKGRFHVSMRLQQFSPLTGWAPVLYRAPLIIAVGEFEAIHQPQLAGQIRARTEPEGFERERQGQATRPATKPAGG